LASQRYTAFPKGRIVDSSPTISSSVDLTSLENFTPSSKRTGSPFLEPSQVLLDGERYHPAGHTVLDPNEELNSIQSGESGRIP
jgi:hypothetical protein